MARIPVTIMTQPIGTSNPASRMGPSPSVQSRGPALSREQFPQRALNRTQTAARIATSKATALPFVDGNLIANVQLTANTPLPINHGLGRAYVGHMAFGFVGAAGTVFDAGQPVQFDSARITLQCNATCICAVWVY